MEYMTLAPNILMLDIIGYEMWWRRSNWSWRKSTQTKMVKTCWLRDFLEASLWFVVSLQIWNSSNHEVIALPCAAVYGSNPLVEQVFYLVFQSPNFHLLVLAQVLWVIFNLLEIHGDTLRPFMLLFWAPVQHRELQLDESHMFWCYLLFSYLWTCWWVVNFNTIDLFLIYPQFIIIREKKRMDSSQVS